MKKLILTLAIALMVSACGPAQEEIDSDTGLPKKELEKIEESLCNGRQLKRVEGALQGEFGDLADGYTRGLVLTFQVGGSDDCLPKSSESGLTFEFDFKATDACLGNPSAWRVTDRASLNLKTLYKLQDFENNKIELLGTENASAKEFATKTGAKVLRCE